jgi:hypothetical protein
MGDGCKSPLTPEELDNKYVGKWKLIASSFPIDSVLLNSSWIDLRKDQTFYCNTSFFWKTDTLRFQPSQGTWSVSAVTDMPFSHRAEQGTYISLQVDSTLRSWSLSGNGTSDGAMTWYKENDWTFQYDWKIYK